MHLLLFLWATLSTLSTISTLSTLFTLSDPLNRFCKTDLSRFEETHCGSSRRFQRRTRQLTQLASSTMGEVGGYEGTFQDARSEQPVATRLMSRACQFKYRRRLYMSSCPFSEPWFRIIVSFQPAVKEGDVICSRGSQKEMTMLRTHGIVVWRQFLSYTSHPMRYLFPSNKNDVLEKPRTVDWSSTVTLPFTERNLLLWSVLCCRDYDLIACFKFAVSGTASSRVCSACQKIVFRLQQKQQTRVFTHTRGTNLHI